jgi:hypothetical protein
MTLKISSEMTSLALSLVKRLLFHLIFGIAYLINIVCISFL